MAKQTNKAKTGQAYDDQVIECAAEIAVRLEALFNELPEDIDRQAILTKLMYEVAFRANQPWLKKWLEDTVIAHRTLTELGVKF